MPTHTSAQPEGEKRHYPETCSSCAKGMTLPPIHVRGWHPTCKERVKIDGAVCCACHPHVHCSLSRPTDQWGLELGDILSDFEQDHNEEKAVKNIIELLTIARQETAQQIIADLDTNPNPYGSPTHTVAQWIERKPAQLRAMFLQKKKLL